jgi:hypothetical protein
VIAVKYRTTTTPSDRRAELMASWFQPIPLRPDPAAVR